jgi:hypothetical protein
MSYARWRICSIVDSFWGVSFDGFAAGAVLVAVAVLIFFLPLFGFVTRCILVKLLDALRGEHHNFKRFPLRASRLQIPAVVVRQEA